MNHSSFDYYNALEDFYRARQKATLNEALARLVGTVPPRLLAYDEVRQRLKAQVGAECGLREIPLNAIVGSVNRYDDFTRDFLPRNPADADRWARVKVAVNDLAGLPPIEVYQIGETYFVKDGNHRVSVARELGATTIQAYVTEIQSPVPLSPDTRAEDLILKGEYARFLEETQIKRARPEASLELTAPGGYTALAEHIAVHRYFMGLDFQRPIAAEEAAAHWYDTLYLPIVAVIEEHGLLRDFPGRTETDLYLWIAEHRAVLEEELGWEIGAEAAATNLAERFSPRAERVAARLGGAMLEAVTPNPLESGPPPGAWRQARPHERLFSDVLVAITGTEAGWLALEQAIVLAQREGARLHGLHVVPASEHKGTSEAQALAERFERRCQEAGLSGGLAFASGETAQRLVERSRWCDAVIFSLSYPPAAQPLARFTSGARNLVQRCPTPVLAVPVSVGTEGNFSAPISPLNRALLAYDGSPKAEEALFTAAYLAGRWKISLVVASILQRGRVTADTQERARQYLEDHAVRAEFVAEECEPGSSAIAPAILKTAETYGSDLILMGGYGRGALLNVFLDAAVDQVLRQVHKPVLLCR